MTDLDPLSQVRAQHRHRLPHPRRAVDTYVIFLFALLHDSMRLNDSIDPEHGPRAAAFAGELHAEGVLHATPGQLELLQYACFEHTNGLVSSDPTVGVCWDADRLDLPRVGIRIAAIRSGSSRSSRSGLATNRLVD